MISQNLIQLLHNHVLSYVAKEAHKSVIDLSEPNSTNTAAQSCPKLTKETHESIIDLSEPNSTAAQSCTKLANEPHESHVVQPSYPFHESHAAHSSDPKPTEELHAQSSDSEEFHESRTAHSEELHASHSAWSSNPKSTEEVHEPANTTQYARARYIYVAIPCYC